MTETTTAPRRITLSRARGWRMPEGAIKVDRTTRWGNMFRPAQRVISPGAYGSLASPYNGCLPSGQYQFGKGSARDYEIRRVRDAADAVELFESYIRADPSGWPPDEIRSLRGYHIACWCGQGDPCHGNVLMRLANDPW